MSDVMTFEEEREFVREYLHSYADYIADHWKTLSTIDVDTDKATGNVPGGEVITKIGITVKFGNIDKGDLNGAIGVERISRGLGVQ